MKAENKKSVEIDLDELKALSVKYYLADLINKKEIYVKHNPQNLGI
jgi:hypothetical protein